MKRKRLIISFSVIILALLASIIININSGSATVGIKSLYDSLTGNIELSKFQYNILYKIRLPRIVSAILLGGALSISGYLLQSFFRNPIVGPYVLGISSGARLFVGAFVLGAAKLTFLQNALGNFTILALSFVGSVIAMLLVILFATRTRGISSLIIIGIMISYIASAGTNFMVTFAQQEKIASLYAWSQGSFSGVSWQMNKIALFIIIPTMLVIYLMSKPLEAYTLSESYARTMGVNVKSFKYLLIFVSSLLSACVTAFAGPVSFVGIAVPHIARLVCSTSKPKILIPAVFLIGSTFTLIADYITRTVFAPTELLLSTITAALGAPVVIFLMIRRKRNL